jgi:hypothetical protein
MDRRILICLFLISTVFFSLCLDQEEKKDQPVKPVTSTLKETPLSEIQVTACNAADEGGTCETKLDELDLVAREDCCKYLGKCC